MNDKMIAGVYTEKLLAEITTAFLDIVRQDVNELEFLRVQTKIKRILMRETLIKEIKCIH